MRVYNTWREVTLSTSLAETIVQNISGLTLLIKFGLTLPVDDDNAIYMSSRRKIAESVYNYPHDKDKMYVRILESLDTCPDCRAYITVINDEPHYNGFEIKHGAGLMDFSITNATYVFWELADGSTSTLDNPSVTLPAGVSILYADFYKNEASLSDGSTNLNYIGDLKDLPQINSSILLLSCPNITGDLKDLPKLNNIIRITSNSIITGDLKDLCQPDTYVDFSNCSNIIGILNPNKVLKTINLNGTAMTPSDTDKTLINIFYKTIITSGGILKIKTNRTSASDIAFDYLSANGWTITEL